MDLKNEYKVFASRIEEIESGFIWINDKENGQKIISRNIYLIVNANTNKRIYIECLNVENNYISLYNSNPKRIPLSRTENSIIISKWYRDKLGIKTKEIVLLKVQHSNNFYSRIIASLNHPQNVIRIGTTLGIISVILGLLSFFLSISPFIEKCINLLFYSYSCN